MFHKGLNREIIVNTAKEMIENDGIGQFSMHKLADKLNVKTASLYTHIENMDTLLTDVGLAVLSEQKNYLLEAISNKQGDEAIRALAENYRKFALEHIKLYRFIMQMPSSDNKLLQDAAAMTAEPFMNVLEDFNIPQNRKMHWQRALRGLMHGFISEEHYGYFSHYPVTIDESYKIAIDCIINGLHAEEAINNA